MSYPVLLVDDHRLLRDGIKVLIERSGEFQVIAEAENGTDALDLFQRLRPELAVVSVGHPALNGIEAAKQILGHTAGARVVMLSMGVDEEALMTALRCGARGLVLKKDSAQDLLEALRVVAGGGTYYSAQISGHLSEPMNLPHANGKATLPLAKRLTNRELEVLRLVTMGKTSKEVAERLSLSVETVRSYRKSMMRKLGVRNIATLINVAIEEGLTRWTRGGSGSYT
ncbi:MAG TPA: response regulator transcription factor [Bryobacteraceae bacterium]|nr:response regulator transcription factor [Bryobacteraceae bacterium]